MTFRTIVAIDPPGGNLPPAVDANRIAGKDKRVTELLVRGRAPKHWLGTHQPFLAHAERSCQQWQLGQTKRPHRSGRPSNESDIGAFRRLNASACTVNYVDGRSTQTLHLC
jgi:hypothetical protein